MEVQVKARKFGGSIGIIIPSNIVEEKMIRENDTLKMKIEKVADLSFMWAKGKNIKKSTKKIMKEIDEGEDD